MAVARTIKYTFHRIFIADIEKITSLILNKPTVCKLSVYKTQTHEDKLVKFANLYNDSLRRCLHPRPA